MATPDDASDSSVEPLPRLDAAEVAVALVAPTLAAGLVVTLVSGPDHLVVGLLFGGLCGLLFASRRRELRAVRTGDGIERRRPGR